MNGRLYLQVTLGRARDWELSMKVAYQAVKGQFLVIACVELVSAEFTHLETIGTLEEVYTSYGDDMPLRLTDGTHSSRFSCAKGPNCQERKTFLCQICSSVSYLFLMI